MQRLAWTDERLDDLSQRMDAGFDRVDRDIRDVRTEMHRGFTELRGEVNALRLLMLRLFGGLLVAIVAATFLHGI